MVGSIDRLQCNGVLDLEPGDFLLDIRLQEKRHVLFNHGVDLLRRVDQLLFKALLQGRHVVFLDFHAILILGLDDCLQL